MEGRQPYWMWWCWPALPMCWRLPGEVGWSAVLSGMVSSTIPHTVGKGGQNGSPSPSLPLPQEERLPNTLGAPISSLCLPTGSSLRGSGWTQVPLLVHSSHTPAWCWCPSRQNTSWAFGTTGKTKEVLWPGEANK